MRKTRPWFMLALALVSGGLAAFLALRYIRQQSTPLLANEPAKAQVILAARSLPVGSVVTEADLKSVAWPGGALPAGYVRTASEAIGHGVITPVAENEPILASKLATKDAGGGLPIMIKDGMRAMSVRVDEVIGVAGFVLPGTHVDVMLTLDKNPSEGRPQTVTTTVLQNVRTLAAGHQVQRDADGKPLTVTVVTLLVSPEDAELLALAAREGRIQLSLRNPLDTAVASTTGARPNELLAGAAPATAKPSPNRPRRPAAVRREENRVIIEGYKGGERTLTTFQQP